MTKVLQGLASIPLAGLTLLAAQPQQAPAQDDFVKLTTPLPLGRAFHGAAVLGDFLYALGGSVHLPGQGDVAAPVVHVARISPEGTLNQWGETSYINVPRHYINNSTIVLNDTVYLLGGSTKILDGDRVNTVSWTRPLPNGHLMPWQESAPFAESGYSASVAFSTPGWLHITGGLPSGSDIATRTVYSAPVRADGSLGPWQEGPKLPEPLWFHQGAVVGGRAYIWGGLNADTRPVVAKRDVYSAEVLASGELGRWRSEGIQLPAAFYSGSCSVAGPYVFTISPRYDGGTSSNDIWWTYVTPDGMTEWRRRETNMPLQLYHAAATDYRRGIIFVPGGKTERNSDPSALTAYIQLGGEAKKKAEEQWTEAEIAHANSVSTFDAAKGGGGFGGYSFEDAAAGTEFGLPGFFTLDEARQRADRENKPIIMYFNTETAKPCQDQKEILLKADWSRAEEFVMFASIDPMRYPQLAQQYGVFRVPTWVFYNRNGQEVDRGVGVLSLEDLTKKIALSRR